MFHLLFPRMVLTVLLLIAIHLTLSITVQKKAHDAVAVGRRRDRAADAEEGTGRTIHDKRGAMARTSRRHDQRRGRNQESND